MQNRNLFAVIAYTDYSIRLLELFISREIAVEYLYEYPIECLNEGELIKLIEG